MSNGDEQDSRSQQRVGRTGHGGQRGRLTVRGGSAVEWGGPLTSSESLRCAECPPSPHSDPYT